MGFCSFLEVLLLINDDENGQLVARFLAEAGAQPDQCVLAVCGPVTDGAAYCASQVMMDTTGPWRFSETSVSTAAGGAPVVLMNDFVAVGHALSSIPAEQRYCLHQPAAPAAAPEREVIACLGPGTGLGNVFAVWDSGLGRLKVLPSEGCMGHFVRPQSSFACDVCACSDRLLATPGGPDADPVGRAAYVAASEGFVPVDRMLGGQVVQKRLS